MSILDSFVLALLPNGPGLQGGDFGGGALDQITTDYLNAGQAFQKYLMGPANHLFALLAVISVGWSAIMWLLKRNDPDSFVLAMTKRMLLLGVWLAALQNGPVFFQQIIDSFVKLGQGASGINGLSPSAMVDRGVTLAHTIFANISQLGFTDKAVYGLPMAFIAIAILLCFALAAWQLMYTLVSVALIQGLGVIVLGFGGLDSTRDIAKNYFTAAISSGVRLMVLYAIVGIASKASEQWPQMLVSARDAGSYLDTLLYLLIASGTVGMFVWTSGSLANAITTGAINIGGGEAAAFVGGVAASTGAAAAVGGAGVSAVAAAARGGMQATMAGTELAKAHGASGMKAVVAGIGHAANSAATEVARSVSSKVGTSPVSPNAFDARGRSVTSIGTRAANDLMQKTGAERERIASTPLSASSGGNESAAGQAATGQSTKPAGAAVPPGGGQGVGAPTTAEDQLHQGSDGGRGTSVGEAIQRVSPPPLPADGGMSSLPINLNHHED